MLYDRQSGPAVGSSSAQRTGAGTGVAGGVRDRDSRGGRNTVMVAADDDLQRMVDERYSFI